MMIMIVGLQAKNYRQLLILRAGLEHFVTKFWQFIKAGRITKTAQKIV
jgi:hypothetical protein